MTIFIVLFGIHVYADEFLEKDKEVDKEKNDKRTIKETIDLLKEKISKSTGLAISGFSDCNASNYKNNPNIFRRGDSEHTYFQYFTVAAALVFREARETGVI